MRRLSMLALAAVLAACATTTRRASMPATARDWLGALESAKAAAAQGHYDAADRVLYDYAQRYPGTPEARETAYWRALFKLDPANSAASTRSAEEQLNTYLADTTGTLHRAEALALRRIASEIDSLGHTRTITEAPADSTIAADADKAEQREAELQKEIQRLKDQLDKTTEELNRIKKRLTDKTP